MAIELRWANEEDRDRVALARARAYAPAAKDLTTYLERIRLDPRATAVSAVVVPPPLVLDADQLLDDGYRLLEEAELERAPVVEHGRLVGVLSRSVVQRRLAEDEPPLGDDADADYS